MKRYVPLLVVLLPMSGCLYALSEARAKTTVVMALALASAEKNLQAAEKIVQEQPVAAEAFLKEIRADIEVIKVVNQVQVIDNGLPEIEIKSHRSDQAKVAIVEHLGLASERQKRKKLPVDILAAIARSAWNITTEIMGSVIPGWMWWTVGLASVLGGGVYLFTIYIAWKRGKKREALTLGLFEVAGLAARTNWLSMPSWSPTRSVTRFLE